MPIIRFPRDLAFDSEHVRAMLAAFDGACARLHLRKGDKLTDLVAVKIVDLAKAGERDTDRLIALALSQIESRATQPI
jgi:ubiquinone biosynthesis protein UbiJ